MKIVMQSTPLIGKFFSALWTPSMLVCFGLMQSLILRADVGEDSAMTSAALVQQNAGLCTEPFQIGIVNLSVLSENAPKLKRLKASFALEEKNLEEELQRLKNESAQAYSVFCYYSSRANVRIATTRKYEDQFHRKQVEVNDKEREILDKKKEALSRFAENETRLLKEWTTRALLAFPKMDLVLSQGIGITGAPGAVVCSKKSSFCVDITEEVVKIALQDCDFSEESEEDLDSLDEDVSLS